MNAAIVAVILGVLFIEVHSLEDTDVAESDPSKRQPSRCEVCKYLATELMLRLDETGRNKEVIETGHGLEKKKRFKYNTAELRLIEALQEPHICNKILEYNVHAEREGSLRYSKGMSETMQTLHGLKNKGVKVELGIPEELWDTPSAEVTIMQRHCFTVAEELEETIEDWYFHHQDEPLMKYLCEDRFLVGYNADCLNETFVPRENDEDEDKPKKKKSKKNKNESRKGDNGDVDQQKAKKNKIKENKTEL
ncbi:unnamed protein product [Owenia fusiformis]|uniref:Uncharacterized protein n=1 Tax=Owenia fusiformis TaxID=6347 RepID=A0A8J1U936_OWEFU|nr:unnamed protein product [Owenia fusiformis]